MKAHSDRSISIHKKLKWIYLAVFSGMVLAVGIVLLALYLNGYFYVRKNVQVHRLPVSEEMAAEAADTMLIPSDILSKTVSLLKKNTNSSPYVVNWYVLPGSVSSIPALQSEYLSATDQVLLIRCYIESGKQDAAHTLIKAFERDFTAANGYIVAGLKVSELPSLEQPQPMFALHAEYEEVPASSIFSMEATVEYLRALLEYYEKWGQPSDWTRIEKFADLLYADDAVFPEDLSVVFTDTSAVPIEEGQDIVSVIPDQIPQDGTISMLTLSSLDLEVFRMLSAVDIKYQPMYDRALLILSGAVISDKLPLYAFGYSQSMDGYVYFLGDKEQVELVPSLKIILHLAEEEKAPAASLLWIKEQLYNDGMLHKTYNVLSGSPTTDEEAVDAYGIVLRIARATGDTDLYGKARACLEQHLATSSASAARGAIFRMLDSTRVAVYAKDNLEALLGARL